MTVSVFDITVCDYNLGNRIIMDAVYDNLHALFPSDIVITLPYWEPFGPITLDYISRSDYLFYGGGNHLTSDLGDLFWGVTRENYQRVKGTILLGVGWWKYQGRPSQEVCDVLKTTLNPKYCHSVRDNYTFQMLEHAGIGNILVTGCPTLWNLTPTHCEGIPSEKADAVLFTFSSDYAKHPERDHTIFRILKKQYRDMYFWPQGPEDIHYINDFDFKGEMLHANVGALHQFLVEHDNVDYVGTRLHAGVKALQQRRRSFIIAIDNRAAEKKTDFNLPVIDDVRDLEKAIVSKRPCRIKLPQEAICQWKSQFAA